MGDLAMKTAVRINVSKIVISALLCAIGIIIPLYSPLKVVLEPASFTLGSHIAIFIAMFISPSVAIAVALGTTLGFFLGGFPIVIVLRAATHIVFALFGAVVLQKKQDILKSTAKSAVFAVYIGLIHAVCEVAVVIPFYLGSGMSQAYYAKGFVVSVILLVGVGSVAHSVADFILAYIIWRALRVNNLSRAVLH